MRTLLATLTALMLLATPVVAGDWEDARAAYEAGDYQKAIWLYNPLAAQRNARAQASLGWAYDKGLGVPEDDAKAVHWYRKAAEQGDADAQVNLGLMYYEGEGLLEDYVQAYAWWSIAAKRGHKRAKKNKGIVKKEMTPAQIAEAQKLSTKYWEKYVVPFQRE